MTFEKLYLYALILMVSLWIPFPMASSPSIALFGLVVIYGALTKKLTFNWNWIFFGFVLLYLTYVLFCIPSKDGHHAMQDLEHKLSFLVFPILFSFQPTVKIERKLLLFYFSIACLLLGSYFVLQAVYHYSISGQTNYFHSSTFAPTHHPSYVSAFFCLAIFFLLTEYIPSESKKHQRIAWGITLFFVLLHLPLESLSGILLLGSLISFLVLRWAWKKFSTGIFFTFLLSGILCCQLILWIQPSLKDNLSYTSNLVTHYVDSPTQFIQEHPKDMSGNQARLVIWTITTQLIMDHPFGIGLGNLEQEMRQRLVYLHQDELVEKNYNPHNQFLQIAAEIGVFGFSLFCALLFLLVRFAWKRKDLTFLFLLFSLILNSLFESMLQRQSGIVFYLMFFSLFLTVLQKPKTSEA
ncbi:MAG: O-antigen ligase family protein [Flavobacteriales bacterium]